MQGMGSNFGARLDRILLDRDMTQTDLARLVWNETYVDKRGYEVVKGKDRISSYINGKQQPSSLVYNKILEVLKLTPEELPLRRRPAEWAAVRRTVLREQDRLADKDGGPQWAGPTSADWNRFAEMTPMESSQFLEFLRSPGPDRKAALELMKAATRGHSVATRQRHDEEELSMRLVPGDSTLAQLHANVVVSAETALQVMRLIQDDQKKRKASGGN